MAANKGNGLASLNRRLNAIPKAVRASVQPELLKAARKLADDIRSFAPVDDGDLRDSIAVTPGGSKTPAYSQPGGATFVPELSVFVTAGNAKVRYAHLVEFGTLPHAVGQKFDATSNRFRAIGHPGTAPQPFFWPAVRLNGKKLTREIKRAVRKAVKTAK